MMGFSLNNALSKNWEGSPDRRVCVQCPEARACRVTWASAPGTWAPDDGRSVVQVGDVPELRSRLS